MAPRKKPTAEQAPEADKQTKAKAPAKAPAAKKKTPAKGKKKAAKKKPVKKEPLPKGRPAWEPDLTKVEDWARQGLKDNEIAALCGVCKQTFSEHKTGLTEQNEPSELAKALDRGRAKGVSMASNALWKNIVQGDTQAIKFYLERKGGWKQHQVIETGPKKIEDMTDDELREALARLEGEATS